MFKRLEIIVIFRIFLFFIRFFFCFAVLDKYTFSLGAGLIDPNPKLNLVVLNLLKAQQFIFVFLYREDGLF
jgi:hypothetical protein